MTKGLRSLNPNAIAVSKAVLRRFVVLTSRQGVDGSHDRGSEHEAMYDREKSVGDGGESAMQQIGAKQTQRAEPAMDSNAKGRGRW